MIDQTFLRDLFSLNFCFFHLRLLVSHISSLLGFGLNAQIENIHSREKLDLCERVLGLHRSHHYFQTFSCKWGNSIIDQRQTILYIFGLIEPCIDAKVVEGV
jgi:hypothetical protein